MKKDYYMERKNLVELIRKVYNQEYLEEDLKTLSKWLYDKKKKEELSSLFSTLWKESEKHHKDLPVDSNKVLSTVLYKIESLEKKTPQKHFIKHRQVIQNILKIAALFLLPLILYFSGKHIINRPKSKAISWVQVNVPKGEKKVIMLSDGTKIWINSGSKLSYPRSFKGKYRVVHLTGEACFKDTKDKHHPFIVKTKEVAIKVLGTVFNVSAYPDDNNIETTLASGKVLAYQEGIGKSIYNQVLLSPGERAVFSKERKTFSVQRVDPKCYISWRNGNLNFLNLSLKDVIKKLSRWYNVDFKVRDNEIENFNYTVSFHNDSLSKVMNILSQMTPIKFVPSGKNIFMVRGDIKRFKYFFKPDSIH